MDIWIISYITWLGAVLQAAAGRGAAAHPGVLPALVTQRLAMEPWSDSVAQIMCQLAHGRGRVDA